MALHLVTNSSIQIYCIFAAASLTPCPIITAVAESLGPSGYFYGTILRTALTEKPLSGSLNHKRSESEGRLTAPSSACLLHL